MTRVATVEARTVRCPLPAPLRLASRIVDARVFTLVRLTDDEGAAGLGFSFAGYCGSDLVTHAVEMLAPIVLGQHVDATTALWEDMGHCAQLEGRAGAVMRAVSAIDIALWDLRGRRTGLSLQRLLGAATLTSVPAYLAGGYGAMGGETDLLAEVDSHLVAGAHTIKIKIGLGSSSDDVSRVADVRQRAGSAMKLIADANGRWRSLAEALPTTRALADLGLHLLEDPFPDRFAHLYPGLHAATGLPLASGETLSHPQEFYELAATGGVGAFVVDATACGGVTGFARIAAHATLRGLEVHTHWFSELHAALAATVPGAILVEHFADERAMPFSALIDGGPQWAKGHLILSDAPGHGLTLNHSAVERFALGPWKLSVSPSAKG